MPAPYVPLNLLALAATVRPDGHEPAIVDQTLALLRGQATDGPGFHRDIAELILGHAPEVIALTTMCNSYPQTLALARECRALDPAVKIILGGPQATVVDVPTMVRFPFLDAVVRNEADATLCRVLSRWSDHRDLEDVPGVTWRRPNDAIARNVDAPLLQDLDALPYPAFDLYPLSEIDVALAPIEAGRGCPYACTFCSTNEYFNRRYRIKSPQRLIAEMTFLRDQHGFDSFDFVHDMLTVDRRWVEDFCSALTDGEDSFRWGCSARVDRVDEGLLARMADAGCVGIFFGVETGSQRMQSVVRKNLQLDRVMPVMRTCVDHGMAPTGSFITGFPDETIDDALDSFTMALDILQLSARTRAQMHLLAPLPGSPLYETRKDDLRFDGHSSDISMFLLNEAEIANVRRYPDIFPNFYYIPTPYLDRELAKAISAVIYTCPTVFLALRSAGADLRDVLIGWTEWQRRELGEQQRGQDYYLYQFGLDLSRYLEVEVLPLLAKVAPHLPDLVSYFAVCHGLKRGLIRERTVFRQYEYDVRTLTQSVRATDAALDPPPKALNLLFVNLALVQGHGYVFLEVDVPRHGDPLVRPGDALEIRDPVTQVRTRPELVIRNKSQRRAFAAKHHLTPRHLRALGLSAVPARSPVYSDEE